jgi:hypothetical protein
LAEKFSFSDGAELVAELAQGTERLANEKRWKWYLRGSVSL